MRSGSGILLCGRRERPDRELVITTSSVPAHITRAPRAARRPPTRTLAEATTRHALAQFAIAACVSPAAFAVAALVALWIAACAVAVSAHEGFWFEVGSAAAFDRLTRLVAIGAAIASSTATAARCGAAPAWPAMLRETGASRVSRQLALGLGDVGPALAPTCVAALPAIWMLDATATSVVFFTVLVTTLLAGTIARIGAASIGSLVGAALAIALNS